jgi:hypothetical protein
MPSPFETWIPILLFSSVWNLELCTRSPQNDPFSACDFSVESSELSFIHASTSFSSFASGGLSFEAIHLCKFYFCSMPILVCSLSLSVCLTHLLLPSVSDHFSLFTLLLLSPPPLFLWRILIFVEFSKGLYATVSCFSWQKKKMK